MKNILVVDDEPDIYELLEMAFAKYGNDVKLEKASNGKKAIEKYMEMKPDIVLMDIRMPGADGIKVTEKLRKIDPDAVIYVFTAFRDEESAARAMNAGAAGIIKKSENIRDVVEKISRALDKI